ncbi:tetratricopeptide repeat protein [Tsukamurella paurometabola]|uniref:ATP-dependent transcriptional regulator n=1 Tax=Tsukamurella paurometabola TaxID=2061 RepID=A0A3P8KI20_TSUPA|nr:NB-ARC domain-containing protein [Tsukamurella paurometabola]UEA82844.1 hypothetical protein LK411_21185 [Tsukamurella paurometabola]VDR39918.1 ATP-dependent transcriptional regulator [Tsukamurella paurometabola]
MLVLLERGIDVRSSISVDGDAAEDLRDSHVVDFAVRDKEGSLLEIHQVKSTIKSDESAYSPADAIRVLTRMIRNESARLYVLTTNARPSLGLAELVEALKSFRTGEIGGDDLVVRLREICWRSPAALQHIDRVEADDLVQRFSLCEIEARSESETDVSARILDRVSSWRRSIQLPLGQRAGGVLCGYLENAVFKRGASHGSGLDSSSMTFEEFCRELAMASEIIADVVSLREYGDGIFAVPPASGVLRTREMTLLEDRLLAGGKSSIGPKRCALVGKSGIGKTRLAAMYCHRNRALYDRIVWIDAESDSSIVSSLARSKIFSDLVSTESSSRESAPHVSERFRSRIDDTPGRWLLVLDNAVSFGAIEKWIPRHSDIHVVFTSINARDWGSTQPIEVRRFERHESVQLLLASVVDDGCEIESGQIESAADAVCDLLGDWPLAIRVAAASLGTRGRLITHCDLYRDEIDRYRLLADDELERDGYDKPLLAALHIAVDGVLSRSYERAISDSGEVASEFAAVCSVLAPTAIPAKMVYEAATTDLSVLIDTSRSPATDVDEYSLLRTINSLRTASLINDSVEVDARSNVGALSDRYDMNEIVQHVIRQKFDLYVVVEQVGGFVSHWIAHYMDHDSIRFALEVEPHAEALLTRLHQLSDPPNLCALLAGNLAHLYHKQGRYDDAERLLNDELNWLEAKERPHLVSLCKTHQQLATVLLNRGDDRSAVVEHLIQSLEAMNGEVARSGWDWDGGGVAASIVDIVGMLERRISAERPGGRGSEREIILSIRAEAIAAMKRFGFASPFLIEYSSIQRDLEVGDYPAVLDKCRQVRQSLKLTSEQRVEVDLCEIEALAYTSNYSKLEECVGDLKVRLDLEPNVHAEAAASILDCVQALIVPGILGGVSSKLACRTLLGLANGMRLNDFDRYCSKIFTCCLERWLGNRDAFREQRNEVALLDPVAPGQRRRVGPGIPDMPKMLRDYAMTDPEPVARRQFQLTMLDWMLKLEQNRN